MELLRPKTHLIPAIIAIITASFFNALMGAVVKYASSGITVEAMTFWRNFICLIIVFPWLSHMAHGLPSVAPMMKPKNLKMHLIRGLCGLSGIYLFFISLQFLSLTDATLLANTIPIFIPITAYVWKRIPIIHSLWWGIGIAFVGIILIIKPGVGVFQPASLIGISGAIIGSVAVFALRLAHFSEPPVRTLFFYFLIASVVAAVGTLPRFSLNWIDLNLHNTLVLLSIGGLGMAFQLCFTYAAKWAPVRLTSPFLYLSVVFSMVLQWLVWHQPVPLSSILGFCFVFVGAMLVVYLYPKHQL